MGRSTRQQREQRRRYDAAMGGITNGDLCACGECPVQIFDATTGGVVCAACYCDSHANDEEAADWKTIRLEQGLWAGIGGKER